MSHLAQLETSVRIPEPAYCLCPYLKLAPIILYSLWLNASIARMQAELTVNAIIKSIERERGGKGIDS